MKWSPRAISTASAAGLLALVLCGPVVAQEPFRITPSASFLLGMDWSRQWLVGEMTIPAGGRPGSGAKVDFSADLGMDQADASGVDFQAVILDRHLVTAEYFSCSPTGLRKPARPLVFHNKTYPAGSPVEAKIDFNHVRLSYGYKFREEPSWWIAARGSLHYVNFAATLNGETEEAGLISNSRTLDGVFPVIGFEARHQLPHGLDLGMELEGTHLITRGFLVMMRLGASWEVYPNIVLTANCGSRLVHYLEDNQELNNEWFSSFWGASFGLSFGF
jgi:hypothetical protein